MNTYTTYRRLHHTRIGRALFARVYGWRVPYFRPLRMRIDHVGPHRAELVLPKRRALENHLGTVHAIAVCNGLEAAMGLLAEATTPPSHRWIPIGMEVEYLAKSTTDLQCVALSTPDQWPAAGDETLDVPVGVAATREDGTVVVAGTITIRVGPRPAR